MSLLTHSKEVHTASLGKQRGVALILVLGLMAIITILATTITDTVQFSAKQYSTLKEMRQAYWYARGGEVYALTTLSDLVTKSMLDQTDINVSFPITGEGQSGMVSYQLTPLHSCMNINSLDIKFTDPDARSTLNKNVWTEFLDDKANVSGSTATMLLQRAADWIDEDTLPKAPYGAEALFYGSQTPPQQPPNSAMLTARELGSLDALTLEETQSLLPFLCSRPDDNTLGVHPNDLTVESAYLLSVITGGKVDTSLAQSIIEDRPEDGYATLNDFWAHAAFKDIDNNAKAGFTFERHYFKLDTQVVLGNASFRLISLLHIDSKDKTRVITRRYGVTP